MRREMKAVFKVQAEDGEVLVLHHMHGFVDINAPGMHKIVDRRHNKYMPLGNGVFRGGISQKLYTSTDPIATAIPGVAG